MFNVGGDCVVAALVSRDLDFDHEVDLESKAPESEKLDPEKTERVVNSYKIEDTEAPAHDPEAAGK